MQEKTWLLEKKISDTEENMKAGKHDCWHFQQSVDITATLLMIYINRVHRGVWYSLLFVCIMCLIKDVNHKKHAKEAVEDLIR